MTHRKLPAQIAFIAFLITCGFVGMVNAAEPAKGYQDASPKRYDLSIARVKLIREPNHIPRSTFYLKRMVSLRTYRTPASTRESLRKASS